MAGPFDWDAVLGPNMDIFGEAIAYTHGDGTVEPGINAIFDEAYHPLIPLGGGNGREILAVGAMGDTTSVKPVLGVQLSQFLVPPAQGDSLTVRGKNYLVGEVEVDGHGGARLNLNDA